MSLQNGALSSVVWWFVHYDYSNRYVHFCYVLEKIFVFCICFIYCFNNFNLKVLELQGATRPSISKHGNPHRKEMHNLELLPCIPFSTTFLSFLPFPILWWTGERTEWTIILQSVMLLNDGQISAWWFTSSLWWWNVRKWWWNEYIINSLHHHWLVSNTYCQSQKGKVS